MPVFEILTTVIILLLLAPGCTDNTVEPGQSFRLTITIKDSAGGPKEGVNIKRMNFLDACVLGNPNPGRDAAEYERQKPEHGTKAGICAIEENGYNRAGEEPEPPPFSVGPIYPSPFNPGTTIRFALHDSCYVKMDMLDWRGRHVRSLIDGVFRHGGNYTIQWTAQDDYGTHVMDGVYTCRLVARNIDTGTELFSGTADCTAYISLDYEQCHIIGQTNSSGVFETSDRDLFPCVQGHGSQLCMDVLADTVGTFSFVDSVRIYMTVIEQDPVEHEVGFSRKIKLINGLNSYNFTWEPEE